MTDEPTKRCPRCKQSLPLEEAFGVDSTNPDGRNKYCIVCARKNNTEASTRRRARAAGKLAPLQRETVKQSPVATSFAQRSALIKKAMANGASTVDSIRKATKLDLEAIDDTLAWMTSSGEVEGTEETIDLGKKGEHRVYRLRGEAV